MLVNGRGNWKLRARPRRVRSCAVRPSSVRPAKRTLPVSWRSVPQMQFTSVLLPEPFGPIRPTRSPGDVQLDIGQCDEAAEALAQAGDLQEGVHRSCSGPCLRVMAAHDAKRCRP